MSHGGVSEQLFQPQGKKRGEKKQTLKEFGTRNRVERVPTLCQGSEAPAHVEMELLEGRGIWPQSSSHGPSWTKQAPCPQTSHILIHRLLLLLSGH